VWRNEIHLLLLWNGDIGHVRKNCQRRLIARGILKNIVFFLLLLWLLRSVRWKRGVCLIHTHVLMLWCGLVSKELSLLLFLCIKMLLLLLV